MPGKFTTLFSSPRQKNAGKSRLALTFFKRRVSMRALVLVAGHSGQPNLAGPGLPPGPALFIQPQQYTTLELYQQVTLQGRTTCNPASGCRDSGVPYTQSRSSIVKTFKATVTAYVPTYLTAEVEVQAETEQEAEAMINKMCEANNLDFYHDHTDYKGMDIDDISFHEEEQGDESKEAS
jgi:hypothetical protein